MQSRHLPALIVSVWLANPAQGAGFALIEQNASGLGNAYAGQAAVAEDASTIFFNPAGLTYVEGRQVVAAGHLIMPSAEFSDAGSTLAIRGDGGDAGVTAFVPNFYYAMDVTPDLKFGLGVNAPFGLTTEYDDTWAGQVQAIKSDLKTVNVNPALGWRVNDRLSLGFGLNWQYIEAELTQGTGAAVNPPEARMEGDDASWGWNIGVLWDIDGFNRLGIAYRAAIDHSLEGKLKTPPGRHAGICRRRDAGQRVPQLLAPTLAGLGVARRPDLDRVEQLRETRCRQEIGRCRAQPHSRDVGKRVALFPGPDLSPQPGMDLALRPGLRRNPRCPTRPIARPGFPTPIACGSQWAASTRFSPKAAVDFGYAQLFVKDAHIVHVNNGTLLRGNYDSRIDILGAQYTHSF
jgi:long-chain fatty acid transport protein